MHMYKALTTVFVLVAILSGCSGVTTVTSNITTFHQLTSETFVGKRLAIITNPPERNQSLEFAAYRAILSTKFAEKGFTIVDSQDKADWVALVSYSIDGGKSKTDVVSVPQYGQIGGGATYQSGTVYGTQGGYASYSGTSYNMPTYGVTGMSVHTINLTEYTRIIAIEISNRADIERDASKRLYEGRAVSRGSCSALAGVFAPITDAMFSNWPGVSGKSQTIEVEWDLQC